MFVEITGDGGGAKNVGGGGSGRLTILREMDSLSVKEIFVGHSPGTAEGLVSIVYLVH